MNKNCYIILILSLLLNLSNSIEEPQYIVNEKGIIESNGIRYRVIGFDQKFYNIDISLYSQLLGMIRTSVIETCIKYYLPAKSKVDILEMIIQMTKAKEKYEFSEVESAYLVFRWIIRNIKLEGPEGNKDPAIVYNSGQGSSIGISSLFSRICSFLEVGSDSISGNLKGFFQARNHTWNYIAIKNSYYLVDTAMALNYKKQSEIDFFFGLNPEIFIRYYFPKESKWQLLSQPYIREKFDSMAYLYIAFHMFGFKTISPDTTEINENQKIILTYNESIPMESIFYRVMDSNFEVIETKSYNISTKGTVEIIPSLNNEKAAYLYLFADIKDCSYSASIGIYKINHSEKSEVSLKRFEINKSKNIRGKKIN